MTRHPNRGDRLWIVDGNNLAHKLYHGVPQVWTRASEPINVLVGWVRSLRRLRVTHLVEFILIAFDGHGRGWRSELYPDYKADRPPVPEDLVRQWGPLYQLTRALGVTMVREDDVEADDWIASYTEAAVAAGLATVIVSTDKDLLQLVRGDVGAPGSVRMARRISAELELQGPAEVMAKFGVEPAQLGDLLALSGDRDEAPGVPGIGPKTAAKILADRGSLEQAIADWSLIPGRAAKLLRDHADQARLSRELVGLRSDLALPIPVEELTSWMPRRRPLDEFFRERGFQRFESAVDPYPGEPVAPRTR